MGLYQADLEGLRDKLYKIVAYGGDVYCYVLEAFRHFHYNINQWDIRYPDKRILSDLYHLGREFGLSLFYQEFVSDFWSRYHYSYGRMIAYNRFHRRYRKSKDISQKYVKTAEHKKHNKQKNAWRIEQKTLRDKSRRKMRKRGPNRHYKKLRSKEHRAWVKNQIHRENWDIFWQAERNQFVDSYCWD